RELAVLRERNARGHDRQGEAHEADERECANPLVQGDLLCEARPFGGASSVVMDWDGARRPEFSRRRSASGAGGGTRTHTTRRRGLFEGPAYASSATPAKGAENNTPAGSRSACARDVRVPCGDL